MGHFWVIFGSNADKQIKPIAYWVSGSSCRVTKCDPVATLMQIWLRPMRILGVPSSMRHVQPSVPCIPSRIHSTPTIECLFGVTCLGRCDHANGNYMQALLFLYANIHRSDHDLPDMYTRAQGNGSDNNVTCGAMISLMISPCTFSCQCMQAYACMP